MSHFKFWGTIITDEFSWSARVSGLVGKAQHQLYFLRKLRKAGLRQEILLAFYRSAIECIVTYHITLWHNMSMVQDISVLERVIKTIQNIIGTGSIKLPYIKVIGELRCLHRALNILTDITYQSFEYTTFMEAL